MLMFRFFLYVLGGDIWYLGYCALYLVLGLILVGDIINTNFPLKVKETESDRAQRKS
jgi:hypothetical protein